MISENKSQIQMGVSILKQVTINQSSTGNKSYTKVQLSATDYIIWEEDLEKTRNAAE